MDSRMRDAEITVWTVGHSTHTYEQLLDLLRAASITAVADVRTAPFSRQFPQFNKDALQSELRMDGIAYSFLGKELGGRPTGSQYYCDGVADYERMAQSSDFGRGLQRVLEGARKYRYRTHVLGARSFELPPVSARWQGFGCARGGRETCPR